MKFLHLALSLLCGNAIFAQVNFNLKVSNTNCVPNGGSAKVIFQAGVSSSNFNYQWSNGSGNTDSIGNLVAGNYSVTVYNSAFTDSSIKNFTVSDAASIFTSVNPQDTICVGTTAILSVSALPAGGSITWSGGDLSAPKNQDTIHVQPSAEQIYTVTYNHATCSGNKAVRVVASPVKAIIAGVVQPSCGLANGAITGAGSGFKANFSWLKNGQVFASGTSILNNLSAGNYTFIIYDGVTGCRDTTSNIILADNTTYASLSQIETTPDSCLNNQGTAQLNVTGGSGNYTFKWSHSNTLTGNMASKLAKGSYRVTISDGVCTPFDTAFFIDGPDSLIAVSYSVINDNCSKSTGSATINASQGTPPYTYLWSNGSSNLSAINLLGNQTYEVSVSDYLGCTHIENIFIDDVAAPSLVFLPFDSLCPNETNGKLKLQASGGQPPYTYSWQHDNTLQSFTASNLAPGNYSATVTDAGNCTASVQTSIAAFNNPNIELGNDTTILKGSTLELQITTTLPVAGVEWFPFIQSANNQLTAYVKPDSTITYSVLLRYGGNACLIKDSITVFVIEEPSEMTVPNIFTPNNDGINDYFYVSYKAIKKFNIKIFDRWGNLVFESFEPDFKWDGNKQEYGSELSNGVFTYVLEYTALSTNKRELLKGSITLLK